MTKIAIVEDNARLALDLKSIVESTPDCHCVGVWHSGEEAVLKLPLFEPDVALMDINLPGISGIEATRQLRQQMPELQVIMVTVYRDFDKIFDALKAGACGYLLKRSSPEEVRRAIADVRVGGAPMTAEIARRVVEAFREPAKASESVQLTQREREVLDLLSEGRANKDIAERLNLSTETVRVHLQHIYKKLHVRSRTEAALKYRESAEQRRAAAGGRQ